MPKFMKSIQIPIITTPPSPILDNVVLYGSNSGLNQVTVGGSKNFDLAGTIIPFSFSDTSPILIGKSQPNLSIGEVVLQIIAPFNDLTTIITIGDSADHSRLFTSDSNDPNSANQYSFTPDYKYTSEVDIYLYITGVNTSGNGIVRIYFN